MKSARHSTPFCVDFHTLISILIDVTCAAVVACMRPWVRSRARRVQSFTCRSS